MIKSYLKEQYQRVKIGNTMSEWIEMKCGVPQGSVLGPLLFNIFINDRFYVIEYCSMYNLADDNIVSHIGENVNQVVSKVEREIKDIMVWLNANCMTASPDKFQGIILGNFDREIPIFHIEDCKDKPQCEIKILHIIIDFKLKFDSHVSELCRKATRQLNEAKFLKTKIDEETRMEIYRSFILSNFNYCPLVWYFCGVLSTKKWIKFRKWHYDLYIMILHQHMKSFWLKGTIAH